MVSEDTLIVEWGMGIESDSSRFANVFIYQRMRIVGTLRQLGAQLSRPIYTTGFVSLLTHQTRR